MTSAEIREKFLKFFENKGHKIVPSSSLIPDDPSVLFTTAGMQQFKEYYTNQEGALRDFKTLNVVTSQKCIRTGDIEEVGDNTHLTFFEMLGNFSFGGYGRREAIEYAYEFITKEMNLEISYVTVYEGNSIVPKDEESKKAWQDLGVKDIREEGADVFWGPTGESGPCGPTTEIYCKNSIGEDIEIWNIVFNEYFSDVSREKLDKREGTLKKLPSLGIDTGMGFERLLTVVNKKESVYETDLFNNEKNKEDRIVADHIKASLFMISDGIFPSNVGAGYTLRRLIRRSARLSKKSLNNLIPNVKDIYKGIYDLDDKGLIKEEEDKFKKTLEIGLKEFKKPARTGGGIDPFILFTSYGFPIELTEELAKEKGIKIDKEDFQKKMEEHQRLSQTASAGMFKGGLLNHEEKTIKLHTAHHLLLAGLKEVVDKNIKQRGSNITEERLRIDFLFDRKLTEEEKNKVENWVNDKINKNLKMTRKEMTIEEALSLGAEMEFGTKYPNTVSVYFLEDEDGNVYSKEFCGGPHVKNTAELCSSSRAESRDKGSVNCFKIQKEEAVAKGIRRIKAILK